MTKSKAVKAPPLTPQIAALTPFGMGTVRCDSTRRASRPSRAVTNFSSQVAANCTAKSLGIRPSGLTRICEAIDRR